MPLEIEFRRVDVNGALIRLGGTVLPVTATATAAGAQVATPNVDGLVTSLRSDVWVNVDIAASPDPTGSAASVILVGPGSPKTVKDRKGLKVSAVRTDPSLQNTFMSDYIKAQVMLAGGGTVTWGGMGGKLKWSGRFLMIPMIRSTASDAYLSISTLTTGSIPASQTNTGSARAYDADGIVLNAYESLWASFAPGGTFGAYTLQLVAYPNTFVAPANWVFIAGVNGDDGSLKLGTGVILPSGGSYRAGVGNFDSVVVKEPAVSAASSHISPTTPSASVRRPCAPRWSMRPRAPSTPRMPARRRL